MADDPGELRWIEVRTTNRGKPVVRPVLVADTSDYGTYFTYSTSATDGQPLHRYLTNVYRPTCTCHAGQFDFQNCKALGCVHVQAARKRHAQRVYPSVIGNDALLDDISGKLFQKLLPAGTAAEKVSG